VQGGRGRGFLPWHSAFTNIASISSNSTNPPTTPHLFNCSLDENGTAALLVDGASGFSVASAVWAAGQLAGSFAAAPLPRMIGFRYSFVFLSSLSVVGQVMYGMAGVVSGDAGKWIAWIGKAVNGFGDGSLAMGLGYITIALFENHKLMQAAIFHGRTCMGFGMVVGASIAIGFTDVAIYQPSLGRSDGTIFSGGDLVGWAMAVLLLPVMVAACWLVKNEKPPTKEKHEEKSDNTDAGADGGGGDGGGQKQLPKSCGGLHCSRKAVFWLTLVFAYGSTSAMAVFFLPVFPYCPGFCNELELRSSVDLAEYINYVALGAFFSGFLGCMINSLFASSPYKSVQASTEDELAWVGVAVASSGDGGGGGGGGGGNGGGGGGNGVVGTASPAADCCRDHWVSTTCPVRHIPFLRHFCSSLPPLSVCSQAWAGLPLLRAGCVLVTLSVVMMYAGYRTFDTEAVEVSSGQIVFIAGVCFYFMATSSLSAGMPSMYKQVIPKSRLSTMMPMFAVCLDVGKVGGGGRVVVVVVVVVVWWWWWWWRWCQQLSLSLRLCLSVSVSLSVSLSLPLSPFSSLPLSLLPPGRGPAVRRVGVGVQLRLVGGARRHVLHPAPRDLQSAHHLDVRAGHVPDHRRGRRRRALGDSGRGKEEEGQRQQQQRR
jgi:hypothetical protein